MKLLLVEDEPLLLDEMDNYLTEQGYRCEKATTFEEGEDKISLHEYDAIVLDITLPGGNGLKLLELLKSNRKKPAYSSFPQKTHSPINSPASNWGPTIISPNPFTWKNSMHGSMPCYAENHSAGATIF